MKCGVWTRLRALGQVPDGTASEAARLFLFAKAAATRLEAYVRGLVDAAQEPIDLGDGTALGMSPGRGWILARSYERTIAELEAMGMTLEQREAWFRYCAEHHFPSRVKKALEELVGGKTARALIGTGGWLDETTVFEFGVWTPEPKREEPAPAPAAAEDDADAKMIAEASPDKLKRALEALDDWRLKDMN